uniref:Uncharacterized protein n=1 Tax=Anopheles farauti TaxID=69004 RepID=A0A182QBU6_9DIPT
MYKTFLKLSNRHWMRYEARGQRIPLRRGQAVLAPWDIYLFTQLWFTLLDRSYEHVTDTGGWQTVQTSTDAMDGDDIQVLGTSIISAVDDGADRQTERDAEFSSRGSSTSCRRK